MLFDLRSRGRRRTVRTVYAGLALLMGAGLVLFGVGAGNGFGGILNAFTGGGSNSSAPVISQQEKSAARATRLHPNDPNAWSQLVQARDAAAKQDYNPNTGAFTAAGKSKLVAETQAWQRYVQLTKNPDSTTAILAARAYALLGQYSSAAQAWEAVTLASPSEAKGYECLAATAYAAKQTRKGDLASAKALTLVPKAQQALLKRQFQQAKTQPSIAQAC